ncbi:disulfide oxidoreductase [Candidatus Woesearchaeota archaeon]|jgi:hybrid cluster-associated redox disulfide protein|nr:disulfide oxidoreductase [Candidatus Woesearchaeota archaeon]|tara:strand:+ start:13150 stop:13368 length:219 start_codon:yes stop_codon:yes gene_type:complete
MQQKKPITKNISIGDLVKEHPESVQIMMEHGMNCVGCHIASDETLEQGAESHAVDTDNLVNELNIKILRSRR